jgi:XTP/dITP diphosphohydrolase
MPKLLLGTNNPGKVGELKLILEGCGWELFTPRELGIELDIEETGETYLENAKLKALTFAEASGLTALADDSGMEVDALDGRPGIMSARYAGDGLSDPQRAAALLDELAGVPEAERTARFRCVIVIAELDGDVESVEGAVEGRIATEARGENGFGYDPVFIPEGYELTAAELPPDQKHAISHRGVAARKARELLTRMLND